MLYLRDDIRAEELRSKHVTSGRLPLSIVPASKVFISCVVTAQNKQDQNDDSNFKFPAKLDLHVNACKATAKFESVLKLHISSFFNL